MRPDHRILLRPALIPATDADSPALAALIGRCWADYPGVLLYPEEIPELDALASYYAGQGGMLWTTPERDGMVAARPGPAAWEICRVYVHPGRHGSGLGHALMDVAERHAAGHGAEMLELWSDTRFARAHRFYEKRGYRRGGTRALHDLCNSVEHHFSKPA